MTGKRNNNTHLRGRKRYCIHVRMSVSVVVCLKYTNVRCETIVVTVVYVNAKHV